MVSALVTTPSMFEATYLRNIGSTFQGLPRIDNQVVTSSRPSKQSCCSNSNCKANSPYACKAENSTYLWLCQTSSDGHDSRRQYTVCENRFDESLHIWCETERHDIASSEDRCLIWDTWFTLLNTISMLNWWDSDIPGSNSVIAICPVEREIWKRVGCLLDRQKT